MFYSETMPKSLSAPARARELLERVDTELPPDRLDDARLLLSEIVANAVEHVSEEGDIEVRIHVLEGVLRFEVLDPGPGFTYAPRDAESSYESGWGLHFAGLVADRWAADRDDRARVWFELERHKER
jgi:anti-sigma regulatory factor (Ser/Thr protein kinase)